MAEIDYFNIGESADLVESTRAEECDSCKEVILKGDRFLQIEYAPEGTNPSFPYGINICKTCIKTAAKRLGVLR